MNQKKMNNYRQVEEKIWEFRDNIFGFRKDYNDPHLIKAIVDQMILHFDVDHVDRIKNKMVVGRNGGLGFRIFSIEEYSMIKKKEMNEEFDLIEEVLKGRLHLKCTIYTGIDNFRSDSTSVYQYGFITINKDNEILDFSKENTDIEQFGFGTKIIKNSSHIGYILLAAANVDNWIYNVILE